MQHAGLCSFATVRLLDLLGHSPTVIILPSLVSPHRLHHHGQWSWLRYSDLDIREKTRVGVGHGSRFMNSGQETIRDLRAGVQSHCELKIAKRTLPGIRSRVHSIPALLEVLASGRATALRIHDWNLLKTPTILRGRLHIILFCTSPFVRLHRLYENWL